MFRTLIVQSLVVMTPVAVLAVYDGEKPRLKRALANRLKLFIEKYAD